MTDALSSPPVSDATIEAQFNLQMQSYMQIGQSTAHERIALLNTLERAVLSSRPQIQRALFEDFGKPPQEVDLVDIYYVLREIRHTRRHLRKWMRPQHVSTPLAFMGSRAFYYYEPKGVCLLISPWNYPLNLTLGPLIHAIAAGCTAIIKPSEATPRSGALMKEMLESIYPKHLVSVIEGDASVAQKLLSLPFHHLFFTGSPAIGKLVMQAASKHLSSFTLELGGKCPAIVDASANPEQTAHRIIHTKFVNAGQTCIAPDYVLAHEGIHDILIEKLQQKLQAFYPDAKTLSSDYAGIIHQKHLGKMVEFVNDATDNGARIVTGGNTIEGSRKFAPTILSHVPLTAKIMQEEIFGPILPVIKYKSTDEAISVINNLERPLGLYVFGKGKEVTTLMKQTRAGGSCINQCALNYYNPNLPFGGVNNSGIGKSHGFTGFQAFSNTRSVYRQIWPYSPLDWLHAPYTKAKQVLIDFTLRWM